MYSVIYYPISYRRYRNIQILRIGIFAREVDRRRQTAARILSRFGMPQGGAVLEDPFNGKPLATRGDPLAVGAVRGLAAPAADLNMTAATTAGTAADVLPLAAALWYPVLDGAAALADTAARRPPAGAAAHGAVFLPVAVTAAAAGNPAFAPAVAGAVFPMNMAAATTTAAVFGDASIPPAGILAGVRRAVFHAVADDDGGVVLVGVFAVRALAVDEVVRCGIAGIPAAGGQVLGERAVGQILGTGIVGHAGHTGLANKLHMHRGFSGHGIDVRHIHGNLVVADEGLITVCIRHHMGVDGFVVIG